MPNLDTAYWRRSQRHGRETGRRVYIPAETLQSAGIDPHAESLLYHFWPGERGRILVQLREEKKHGD